MPRHHVQTEIHLPASKSICNRALIINALSKSDTVVENLSDCDDTLVMENALRDMPYTINIMAAGTAMRFLTSFLAVSDGEHIITGTERMKQRPIKILVDALRQLGAQIEYTEKEGYPPLKIKGTELKGKSIQLPGNVSSQYISSLLMIGPALGNGLKLEMEGDVISRPYINMTLNLMNSFGAEGRWTSDHCIEIGAKKYSPIAYRVENDWSAACDCYEIAALSTSAKIVLPGLLKKSFQGDSVVKDLFEKLGVYTTFNDRGILLEKSGKPVDKMEYNFINQPDLAQTFVVTCCLMNIPFVFSGLQSLKIKETDRITALIAEMRKMGFIIKEEKGSILRWNGKKKAPEHLPVIDTYEDHRMAMAFAPAALVFDGLMINHPEVVSKSYPQFWTHLKEAGFNLELKEI